MQQSKEDNWAHRSAGMKCASCMWFVPKGDGPLGRCRRHAPSLNAAIGWPAVFKTDWCGDHKINEDYNAAK